jgi:hypothetical protein
VVACAERRCKRAEQRLMRASAEVAEAADALDQARLDRLAWIEATPLPQMEMF